MAKRTAEITRKTKETEIRLRLNLDGAGEISVSTGLGFYDHMLTALAKHAGFDLELTCKGDLEVDDHHTIEDCAIVFGSALDEALGDKVGIVRFGSAYAPLDESLSRAVVDLSGRPYSVLNLTFEREVLGDIATENLPHFFSSFATAAGASIHVDLLRGENDHHRIESAYKAFALALKQAVSLTNRADIPSTKGSL